MNDPHDTPPDALDDRPDTGPDALDARPSGLNPAVELGWLWTTVLALRLAYGDLVAAGRATLTAADEGEVDPLWYLRDALPAAPIGHPLNPDTDPDTGPDTDGVPGVDGPTCPGGGGR